MSDKVETFPSDIGEVTIDTKKQSITVDGKPLHEVLTEKSAMELLLKDLVVDREIMTTMRANAVALKTWLPGIGNRAARDVFRKYIEDQEQCLKAMISQKNMQLITLVKLESQWKKQQPVKDVKDATVVESNVTAVTDFSAAEDQPVLDVPVIQPEFQ